MIHLHVSNEAELGFELATPGFAIRCATDHYEVTLTKVSPDLDLHSHTLLNDPFLALFIMYICTCNLTLVLLNKLRCHTLFKFSANQITWSRLLIQIHILNGKQCRSRSVGFFKPTDLDLHCLQNRTYPGSTGLGLTRMTYSQIRGVCRKWFFLISPQKHM